MNLGRTGPILCFGEVLARLSSKAGTPLSNTGELRVNIGGAEANVAALLAQLGHEVEMITALPCSALGDLCLGDLRRYGIGTREVIRNDGRLGLYFFEPTGGGGRIIYDREQTAFAADASSFDWQALAARARWFHLSGINLALGGGPARGALEGAAAMKRAGVPVSFDVNHRASLWEGKSEADLACVRDLAATADVLFASGQDIARLLGNSALAKDSPSASQALFAEFKELQLLASTHRLLDNRGHKISARIDTRDGCFETEPAPLPSIVDRIGSGDAFAGAVVDATLTGGTPERCARAGLAAAVSKHGIAGDHWVGTRAELDACDPYSASDIRR